MLSEAFSHDPFETRVRATYGFVRELLSQLAEDGPGVQARARRPLGPDAIGMLRAKLTDRPVVQGVLAEDLARVADTTVLTQPGVPRGLRRTGRFRTVRIPVADRFVPTLTQRLPAGGWMLDASAPAAAAAVALLQRHGVRIAQLDATPDVDAEIFRVDSVVTSARPFQGHREVRLTGAWRQERRALPRGAYLIPADQPFALLALHLLEPQSDDGLVTWNVLDPALRTGADYPIARLRAMPAGARALP